MAEAQEVDLGDPGPALSRSAPFYRGFFVTLGALAAVVIGFAVKDAASDLELVLVAGFLAVGLNPVVSFAERRGIRRGWAVLGVAVIFFVLLATIVFVLGSALREQVVRLVDQAPRLVDDLRHNRTVARLDAKYHVLSALEKRLQNFQLSGSFVGSLVSIGQSVLTAVVDTVIVFVLTLYFLAALPRITNALNLLAPASRRERVAKLGDEITRRVGRYAIGALSVALIAGTVTVILLYSVGLGQYALALGLLVGLLDLLPLVGSLLGAAVVCLVALASSPGAGIACVIFYVIYETLEGYVIYPRVMRSSVDVPEYVTIIAVLVGGAVDGIPGALMALPTAAALILLVREVWVRRQDTR